MHSTNLLVRRCHRLLRRFRELPLELEAEAKLSFSRDQLEYLGERFAEFRSMLLED
jgi:hypothetical protein